LRLAAHLQLLAQGRVVPLVTVRFSPEEAELFSTASAVLARSRLALIPLGVTPADSMLEPAAAAAN